MVCSPVENTILLSGECTKYTKSKWKIWRVNGDFTKSFRAELYNLWYNDIGARGEPCGTVKERL